MHPSGSGNKKEGGAQCSIWETATKSAPAWWLKQLWALIKELWYDWEFYKYELYIPDYEEARKRFFKKRRRS